jgi:class 3 adenylate cyclase
MRSVLLALRRRMLVKVFLAVGMVVTVALIALAWRQSRGEIAQLKASTRGSAEQIAAVIVGNIETTMLQGDGIHVRRQLARLKQALPDADIHIFDPRGVEVFGEAPPPPDRASLPAPLAAILTDGQTRADGGWEWRPIANTKPCHACHPAEPALRGVLAVAGAPSPPARELLLGLLVENAFVQIMTAEKEGELDRYFEELSGAAPGIRRVGVYGAAGELAFGAEVAGVTRELLDASLRDGASRRQVPAGDVVVDLVPLVMTDRCEQCHERDVPVRGVLAVALATELEAVPRAAELSSVIDTSLRYIMLSSLGRLIGAFLDEVVATGAVAAIALYDAEGRTYYTSAPPPAPEHVGSALASRQIASTFVGASMFERVRVVHPLVNDAKCARCHGADSPVRGAVSVSLSTRAAAEARDIATRRATMFIVLALLLVLAVLYALLQTLVVSPVQRIGAVADAVGHGKLEVRVHGVHPEGDEVQRLGSRINEMIRGLRTELHMRRFVSRGAADAARGAADASTASGQFAAAAGVRREATVLFTDIRGFTSYAETVPPETVVEMLNRFLQVQADVVHRHGGDIDKYVGDEVMAVFHGDDAAPRAVRAALEMIAAVEAVRAEGETLAVGAGVSKGEVVHGPIGSGERLDFTVIGDVVNTGARLCSTARGSEVLVSAAVRDACGELDDIELDPIEPLQLKGKRQPIPVFRARQRAATV